MIKNSKKQTWHDEAVGSFVIQRSKIWFVGLFLAIALLITNGIFLIGTISAFSQKQQIGNEIGVLLEAVKNETQKKSTSNSFKSSTTQPNSLEEQNKFTSLIQEIKLTWSSGKYEESLSMAKSSLNYAKNNIDKSTAHYWIGLSYYKLEDYVNSEKEMKTAVDLDPSFVGPYNTLSALSMTKNDYQTALEYAKKCAEADNNYAWCHNALGLSYLGLGEKEKGIEELRQAVKLAPESVVFQDNLNRALQKN
jgi:tetratricopeptide (TPR) repeat protein